MSRKILLYFGRFLFILALCLSIADKIHNQKAKQMVYRKNYQYIQASMRNYKILLPRTSQIDDNLKIFINLQIGFELMIINAILLGKSLSGYLLLIYYGVQAIVQYLIHDVGRGRSGHNIFFRWQIARYIALFGIAILFTYNIDKTRKPFEK